MSSLFRFCLCLAALCCGLNPAFADQADAAKIAMMNDKPLPASDPRSTLSALFAELKSANISALPQSKDLLLLQNYLSKDLLRLFQEALQAETVCIAAAAADEKPTMIEGDLFSGNVEGFSELAYGKVSIAANHANVALSFMNTDTRFPHAHHFRNFAWPAQAMLVKDKNSGAWLVDDIRFFAPRGLRRDLHDYLQAAKRYCN